MIRHGGEDALPMTNFFTSDTHFGHENIINLCQRPFSSVQEMNDEMIRRWNSVVSEGDTVYHLGDFALGQKYLWPSYREQLNGSIILIAGNHDRNKRGIIYPVLISLMRAYGSMYLDERPTVILAHIPPGNDLDRGFLREMSLDPYADVLLCGHVHKAWKYSEYDGKTVINVGVDVWDFTPRTLDELMSGFGGSHA